jgi:ferredoxin
MRVVIEQSLCAGNGRCYTLAPDLFSDDERGYGVVVATDDLTDAQLELASRAVAACPEHAVRIEAG